MKTPEKCKTCTSYNRAGHDKTSKDRHTKYDNWCCRYGKEASKAIGHCMNEESRRKASSN